MSGGTSLFLTRHGETVWHRENRYAGRSDVELTPRGVGQARQLASWSERSRPDAVVCSPLRRAIQTAEPTAARIGRPLRIVPELTEVDFGIAEGRTLHEMRELDPAMVDRFRNNPADNHFPGAEAPSAAADRAAHALVMVAAEHVGTSVLVVAHNTLLRLGICRLLDVPVRRYRAVFPRLDNAALTELRVPSDGTLRAALISLNVPTACS